MITNIVFSIFAFVLGLCIGSFLNCVIYRLEIGKSFLKGRSFCPHCGHTLTWYDLIPVVSYIFLAGKCRYCKKHISIQYPIVEVVTGLAFLFIGCMTGFVWQPIQIISLVFLWYIASVLITIFVFDLKHYLIPDKVLFPAVIVAILYRLIFSHTFEYFLLAAAIASGFFLFIFLISRGNWMGFGDVKLAILLGFLLGFPNILVGLFLAFFFGAAVGMILMYLKKKGLKSEIPFAPFLILGTFVALFFGQQIIHWYVNFII